MLILMAPSSYAEVRCELAIDEVQYPWVWKPANNLFVGLRSNVHHFWEWSAANKNLIPVDLLKFQGWVLGDAHLFNFAEVKLKDGSYKWSFNDLDDSGIGPFILDFMRFASTTKVSKYGGVDFLDLYHAYLDGVKSEEYKKPEIVKDLRDLSEKEAEKEWENHIEKIIDLETEKINYGIKSIVSFLDGPESMQAFINKHISGFEKVLPKGSKITDLAFRTKETGGSQGLVRVFLSAKVNDEFNIYEFKPLVRPGLDYYQKQVSQEERINGIMNFLWKDSVPADYRYIEVDGKEFFMRIRLPKLFEIHDEEEFLALSLKEQKEYLLFIANWMGKKHREQINDADDFSKELSKSETRVLLEEFMNKYLAEAKKLNESTP
jgi:hypothetical protein